MPKICLLLRGKIVCIIKYKKHKAIFDKCFVGKMLKIFLKFKIKPAILLY